MNKSGLVKEVATGTYLTLKEVEQVVNVVIEVITSSLKRGERVQLSGFGTFLVRERAGRGGVNPKTREKIMIDAMSIPAFKAASGLREAIH
jgi:nucleoid DNA-binding protein